MSKERFSINCTTIKNVKYPESLRWYRAPAYKMAAEVRMLPAGIVPIYG